MYVVYSVEITYYYEKDTTNNCDDSHLYMNLKLILYVNL